MSFLEVVHKLSTKGSSSAKSLVIGEVGLQTINYKPSGRYGNWPAKSLVLVSLFNSNDCKRLGVRFEYQALLRKNGNITRPKSNLSNRLPDRLAAGFSTSYPRSFAKYSQQQPDRMHRQRNSAKKRLCSYIAYCIRAVTMI